MAQFMGDDGIFCDISTPDVAVVYFKARRKCLVQLAWGSYRLFAF